MERYSISKYPLDNYYQVYDWIKHRVVFIGTYLQCKEKYGIK